MGLQTAIKKKTLPLRMAILRSNKIHFRLINPLYRLSIFAGHFLVSKDYRNNYFTVLKYRRHYHQRSSFTSYNRYPDLFSICKNYFSHEERVNILSFGCSTGEEVFTLNSYLPKAKITGVDINKFCLKKAVKKNNNPNISFVHSLSDDYLTCKNFSAIFCLAVLQHPENRDSSTKIAEKFTFSQFEKQLIELDSKLKAGGIFFIDYCDFNFLDTIIAKKYEPLMVSNNKVVHERPSYNSNNLKISSKNGNYRAFIKNSAEPEVGVLT